MRGNLFRREGVKIGKCCVEIGLYYNLKKKEKKSKGGLRYKLA